MDLAIEARQLEKSFGKTAVLSGIDLAVQAGTLLALVGPNGSGKTTTVRILTTLLTADAGTATVGGLDVRRQAAEVRGLIGLTAQHATVDDLLTGKENLELFAGLYHLDGRSIQRRVDGLLEQFDLAQAATRLVRTYSGGMRRRLDLAASMIAAPPILFLDEPTTGLDPRSRAEVWNVIRALVAQGTTILLTTQYLEEADQLADRVAVIHHGWIVADDTPAALKRAVGSERLVLRLSDPHDLARAGAVLAIGAERVDAGSRAVADGPWINLAVQDPEHVRQVLNALHLADIPVQQVELRAPTLDDVFFELTEATP